MATKPGSARKFLQRELFSWWRIADPEFRLRNVTTFLSHLCVWMLPAIRIPDQASDWGFRSRPILRASMAGIFQSGKAAIWAAQRSRSPSQDEGGTYVVPPPGKSDFHRFRLLARSKRRLEPSW